MESNLSRGKDILREITRQLAPLLKQVDQARESVQLEEQLKEAQVSGAVASLLRLRARWDELNLEHKERIKRQEQVKQEAEGAAAAVLQLENELEEKGILSGDIGEYRRRIEGIQERVNSGLLLLEEKGKNLVQKISDLRQSIHSLDSRLKKGRDEKEALLKEKFKLEEELATVYKNLADERRETETVKKAGRQAADELKQAENRLAAERTRVKSVGKDVNATGSSVESSFEKIAFLKEQLAAVDGKLVATAASLRGQQDELAAVGPRVKEAEQTLQDLGVRANEFEKRRADQSAQTESVSVEYQGTKAKLAALRAVESESARSEGLPAHELEKFDEIVAAVSDLIEVEKEYERAIEAALGPDIRAIITGSKATAIEILRLAKEKEQPIKLIAAAGSVRAAAHPSLKPAAAVVSSSPRASIAINNLLANTWITDDLATWLESGEDLPPGGLVTDLAGATVDSRGLICSSGGAEVRQGSLALKRELAEVQGSERALEEAARRAKADLETVTADLKKVNHQKGEATETLQKLQNQSMGISLREQGFGREERLLIEQKADIAEQLELKGEALRESEERLTKGQSLLGEAEAALADAEESHRELQTSWSSRIEAEKAAAAGLADAQVSMASLTERQTHLKSRLALIEDNLTVAKKQLDQEEQIADATEELRHRIQPVHDLYTALRLRAEGIAGRLESQATAEHSGAAVMRDELRRLHLRQSDLSADLNLINENLIAKEGERAQVEAEVGQITKHLVDELGVALETALETEDDGTDPKTWREREKQIRDRLARIGPVNQIAAEEFSKLEERQAFLNRQIDDLMRGQKALRKVVNAIDKKITDKFSTTFEKVNTNFNKVFKELFPGGSAGLVLVDDESGEEPGVEIEAQPEGKRLQSLSLLSGGERSLVGLAFLFALHYTRPSPFYILDEVEAALDVVNLRRFIGLLAKLKKETQFIIITHQRDTMEVGDSIYGVSMQADGISKIISQKLTEEEINNDRRETEELVAAAVGRSDQVEGKP